MNTQSSSTSEGRVNDCLEKLEQHTLRLSTDYLLTLKYNKARDHEEEVADFMEVLDKCSNDIFAVLHNYYAAAQAVAPPIHLAAAARPTPKQITGPGCVVIPFWVRPRPCSSWCTRAHLVLS